MRELMNIIELTRKGNITCKSYMTELNEFTKMQNGKMMKYQNLLMNRSLDPIKVVEGDSLLPPYSCGGW